MPRTIDVYTAPCPLCDDAVNLIERLAASEDTVRVRPLTDAEAAAEAAALGVRAVPAVAVDGALASCCQSGGVTEEGLRAALAA
ncbi:thioredoxin family protein [Rubrivirga sp. S365]|uniref:thioredoxin family protein n=1 Tax=Rubrivirga sp. S365 TaxID=3076080 RepID=UPI0028C7AE61|nr:thioredoxin family protein [Rubrivirga sp. S365]MDT7858097.1 thioredoxin family protein [Rubrivirga sp. S365]